MIFSTEVCLRPRNNQIDLEHDPDYSPDLEYGFTIARICMEILSQVCLGPMTNPLNLGDDLDYDPDPGFVLRSLILAEVCSVLTDSLSSYWCYLFCLTREIL